MVDPPRKLDEYWPGCLVNGQFPPSSDFWMIVVKHSIGAFKARPPVPQQCRRRRGGLGLPQPPIVAGFPRLAGRYREIGAVLEFALTPDAELRQSGPPLT